MKHLILTLFLILPSFLSADEFQPKGSWGNDSQPIPETSRYVYASLSVSPDLLSALSSAGQTTLISIPPQKLRSTAWTAKALSQLSPAPKIHARYGLSCRSGEKSFHSITSKQHGASGSNEYEITLGGK